MTGIALGDLMFSFLFWVSSFWVVFDYTSIFYKNLKFLEANSILEAPNQSEGCRMTSSALPMMLVRGKEPLWSSISICNSYPTHNKHFPLGSSGSFLSLFGDLGNLLWSLGVLWSHSYPVSDWVRNAQNLKTMVDFNGPHTQSLLYHDPQDSLPSARPT